MEPTKYKRPNHKALEFEAFSKLLSFNASIKNKEDTFIGYPCNGVFNLEKFFSWWESSYLSKFPLNDVGNPDQLSSFNLNARVFEREVIEMIAPNFGATPDAIWSYVTSGGTLGNEQGLYIGRERLLAYGDPILYFSEDAHYSIQSLARLLRLEFVKIKSLPNGEMNLSDLNKKVVKGRPAIVCVCIGTTFKGAIDPIEKIEEIISKKNLPAVHYHADGALFGGFLPYHSNKDAPKIDFSTQPFDTVAISGHKFFGSPVPLGIFLSKRKHIEEIHHDFIEYIDNLNVTIPCSRSSLNTLIWWWTLKTTPKEVFCVETKAMMENAKYLNQRLIDCGIESYLNDFSNTVYFENPGYDICRKWSLATQTCPFLGALAHVVVMQHVDKETIDRFVSDVKNGIKPAYSHEPN